MVLFNSLALASFIGVSGDDLCVELVLSASLAPIQSLHERYE